MWYLACVGGGCLVGMAVMMLLLSEWVRLKIKEGTPSASYNNNEQMVAALYRELENESHYHSPIKFSDGWVPVTKERLNIAFERVMQS